MSIKWGPPKIVPKYEVIVADDLDELQKEVQKYMDRGWLPIAGFFVRANVNKYDEEDRYYYQPMILPVEAQINEV